ncbi:uncharacterized protein LOC143042427 [Mytilus galloprovincialis]|uniref:uncharacterized protein LOC143042427 n=1 Tax=Mytilus galloprovincialis TaxID=29158 RepID=UPI003F7BD4EC
MNGFYSNIFGRRSEGERHLLCETCCGGNSFCNRNLVCNHYNQSSVNGSCTSTSGCKTNLICLSGKCQCPTNDYYWSINSCTLPKGINHVCASSNECKIPLLCLVNTCKCPIDKYWDGFRCNSRKMHNAHCNISAECSETLFCTHGICKCDRIDYWTGNNCTEKTTYGHSCLSNDDCKSQQICVDNKCTCRITEVWNGTSCTTPPKECCDVNFKVNDVFTIYPTDALHPKPVYCVIQDGTKWTVIQRRFNGSLDFCKNWTSYKNGFGNVHGEYWLGNELVYMLSSTGRHKIRVQLWKVDSTNKYADYSTFSIGNEANKYLLTVNGYSGTAGDGLINVGDPGKAAGKKFSTYDSDNDITDGNCAAALHAGWWYSECEYSDLNQHYNNMRWNSMGGLKETMIMISRET